MVILQCLNNSLLKPEIITLIIGIILGAVVTFTINRIEKRLEFKRVKSNALMCLKIELKRIETFTNSILNSKKSLGLGMPNQDIPEFELTVQSQQFMYYNEKLATKIYELAKTLESANKFRQVASPLIKDQKNPKFIINSDMFLHELNESMRLIKDINNLVY